MTKLMETTIDQDKSIVHCILPKDMDGRFNMKYDKLQNTYKTLYKKYIHNFTKPDNNM